MIGAGEMLHDVIGCWRTEAEFAFVVGKGDSHQTRSTQKAHKMATVESCSVRNMGVQS